MRSRPWLWLFAPVVIGTVLNTGSAAAANGDQTPVQPPRTEGSAASATGGQAGELAQDLVVNYSYDFFTRYNPNTALDMVNQVPGFQPNDGADKRGFGGAAGNMLIDGRRPSAKQDKPTAILARIPASNVRRIELIRGKVGDIDLLGYSAVVNVVLRKQAPATVRWEASTRENLDPHVGIAPGLNASLADRWHDIQYNVGMNGRFSNYADWGQENVYNGAGNLTERRVFDDGTRGFEGYDLSSFLNASTWLGKNYVQLNSSFLWEHRDELLTVRHLPLSTNRESDDYYRNKRRNLTFEVGLDGERLLRKDLLARVIFLYSHEHQEPFSSERDDNPAGFFTKYKRAETTSITTETIGRLELNWAGWTDHSVQLNLEADYNVLDNRLLQTVNSGMGPAVVDVPNGNVRVSETRGDFLLQDTWSLGDFELEYALGAETSTLSETGDTRLTRHFFFLKPHMLLTWAPTQSRQTQLRFERQVAQLNFSDFASATVFQDNDLALGNPNLRPDTTWALELSQEWRFGRVGVVKVTAFHDWISDVLDLLPVSDTDEVPGNIGSARRWGIQLESTLPLEWLRLHGAKLNLKARWQNSSVTDPVTGKSRVLSAAGGLDKSVTFTNDNEWMFDAAFRQDFNAARWAWGWELYEQAVRPLYKVDQLQIYHEGLHFDAFAETTRWLGVKFRLDAINILDYIEGRKRTVYTGRRSISPVDFVEDRLLHNGARLTLTVSGTF